jgi:hypothetical protein
MVTFETYDAEHEQMIDQAYGGNVRVYPASYAYAAEDRLHDIYDGETPMIAVEVFDHPLAKIGAGEFGNEDRGAWVIGTEDAVMALIESEGLKDWDEQYALRPVEE